MKNLDSTALKRRHREWRRRTSGRLSLILEDVQTPYNVGAIIRTAAAYRVDHLWLVGGSALPTHPRTRKTALGSDRFLTWTHVHDVTAALVAAHEARSTIVGIELADEAVPLHELALDTDAVTLVVGHEDRGLSTTCLEGCDHVAYLPQLGRIGSLNVATAASIAIYEIRRRAWTSAPPPG